MILTSLPPFTMLFYSNEQIKVKLLRFHLEPHNERVNVQFSLLWEGLLGDEESSTYYTILKIKL